MYAVIHITNIQHDLFLTQATAFGQEHTHNQPTKWR